MCYKKLLFLHMQQVACPTLNLKHETFLLSLVAIIMFCCEIASVGNFKMF